MCVARAKTKNSAEGLDEGRSGGRREGVATRVAVLDERVVPNRDVWRMVLRVAVSTPTSLALLLLLRRAGRNWRSRGEQRVRGGGARATVGWERGQGRVWSAARRSLLHGSRHGLRVAVLHESGWAHGSRRLEGVGEGWASREGCEEADAVGKRAEERRGSQEPQDQKFITPI